jgi:hypothetical protein
MTPENEYSAAVTRLLKRTGISQTQLIKYLNETDLNKIPIPFMAEFSDFMYMTMDNIYAYLRGDIYIKYALPYYETEE